MVPFSFNASRINGEVVPGVTPQSGNLAVCVTTGRLHSGSVYDCSQSTKWAIDQWGRCIQRNPLLKFITIFADNS